MIMAGMLLLFLALVAQTNGLNILCYYTNWSQYTPAPYKFTTDNVDPRLCTHVVYAFSAPRGIQVVTREWNDNQMFQRLLEMKKEYVHLKTLLSIGGPNVGREPFVTLSLSEQNRVGFAKNVIKFVRKYNFDGFDLAWQYPKAEDKANYAALVQALKMAFEAEANSTRKPRLLLTASLPAKRALINAGLDIPKLAWNLDMFNIMAFDFAEDWEPLAVFNAALYGTRNDTESESMRNVNWVVNYYVTRGATVEKMNIGISSYGRSFTLRNPNQNQLNSPVSSAGNWNKYSGLTGRMSYHEVCDFINKGGNVTRVESKGNPYVVKGNQWVGYDDPMSVTQKAKYIIMNGYAGALFWSLDYDDFLGKSCNNGNYPLLKAINNAFPAGPRLKQPITEPMTVQPTNENMPMKPLPPKEETASSQNDDYNYNILCYYTNWAQYRPERGQLLPEDIDPMVCTHITFAFCKIVGMELAIFERNDVEMYNRINDLKIKNPKLKTLLSVGGATMGHFPFIEVSRNDINRDTFAKNVIKYVRENNFDGFEVDWEFPGAGERYQFAMLIQKLRENFDEDAKRTGRPRLQLGIATSAGKWVIDAGLDVYSVAPYVDFMNVMTYDYFGSWSASIGFNSALYAHPNQQPGDNMLNVDWSAKYIESLGAPKEKINIGIATYGRSFTLRNQDAHSVMSPHNGPGNVLAYSRTPGIAFYFEICEIINSGGQVIRVESQGNPYVVRGNQWIGYDDVESVTLKAQYVKDNKYGGVIVWTMDDDDFSGTFCNQGKFPLLTALSNKFIKRLKSLASQADETSVAVGVHNAISATWILTLLVALLA